MNFPYEIRLVPKGFMVRVPDGESTVTYSVQDDPETVFKRGTYPPVMSPWGWTICNVALSCPGNNREDLFGMARENLGSLPDLKHKFMLVFNTGEWMFENCFLVATDDDSWWREYEGV